jgi:hypothetical protein
VPAVPKLRKATVPNPKAFLKTHGEIEIRNDLIDCGIDVCSAEVTPFSLYDELLSANRSAGPVTLPRKLPFGRFTKGFCQRYIAVGYPRQEDLLLFCGRWVCRPCTRHEDICCGQVSGCHPNFESLLMSYDSKDILGRWTFPLVPDDNHPGGHHYEHQRGNKYIATGKVALSRCVLIPSILPLDINVTRVELAKSATTHSSEPTREYTMMSNFLTPSLAKAARSKIRPSFATVICGMVSKSDQSALSRRAS